MERLSPRRYSSSVREGEDFPGMEALAESLRRSGEALVGIAAETPGDRILRGERRGEPYAIPASTVLIRAIDHATEHRARGATTLTQRGVEPPEMDGWAFGEDAATS